MNALNTDLGTVVIIGAGGGGIGTAVASLVSAAGARVLAVDRDATKLAMATSRIEEEGGRVRGELCDVTDRDAVSGLFERAARDIDDLSGLVNVVGGLPAVHWGAVIDDDHEENLEALLETNLRVAVRTSRAFARTRVSAAGASRNRPTSIVQIASIAGLAGMPFGAGYAASKAALMSYTRTMALEWGGLGIHVNVVAPGTIRVPKNQNAEDAERDQAVIPLGRRGTPGDVANAVLFLLSESSSWITGQMLAVDGGVSIKPSYLDADGLPVFVQDKALRERLLKP